jgi:hypothetical protein
MRALPLEYACGLRFGVYARLSRSYSAVRWSTWWRNGSRKQGPGDQCQNKRDAISRFNIRAGKC